jgi:hypothetical protein
MNRHHTRMACAVAALAWLSAGVATVQADASNGRTGPAPVAQRRPTVCTEQYAPVCGRVGTLQKTYSNACFARADGATVVGEGPCGGGGSAPTPRP